MDNDGDLDLLLVNHADWPALYRNDGGNTHAWLRVRVQEPGCAGDGASGAGWVGATSAGCRPRDSVGARVYLQMTVGSREFMREVGSSAAYMAQSSYAVHFGLGAGRATVHRLRIEWPWRNASRTLYHVPTRTTLTVRSPTLRGAAWSHRLEGGPATADAASTAAVPIALPTCGDGRATIVAVAGGRHGEVRIGADGRSVAYTAPVGALNDSFTYTVRRRRDSGPADEDGGEGSTATVAVNVVAAPLVPRGTAAFAHNAPVGGTAVAASSPSPLWTSLLPAPDGSNNHRGPLGSLGAAGTPLTRLTPPAYATPGGEDMSGATAAV